MPVPTEYTQSGLRRERRASGCRMQRTEVNKLKIILIEILFKYIYKILVSATSIFLQPLTPSTTAYYSKDCLPGSALLTLLSSGFNLTSLLAPFPLKHREHHPNHTHSPVVFRKVQYLGTSCPSSTLFQSVHSSKHPL